MATFDFIGSTKFCTKKDRYILGFLGCAADSHEKKLDFSAKYG